MAHELWWPAFEAAYRRTATIAVSAELRELRRGQVVSFETAAYPSGGKPERVELILVCREA